MADYFITQTDINLLHTNKLIHLRAFLLNKDNLTVDELSGFITSGDGSDDACSDIRKSCNFTIHSNDETYDIGEYNRIWLNNRVKIELGFEDVLGEIHWYTKGTYVFDSCDYAYSASTKDITFNCSDLVSTLNGTHGGTLDGESLLIEGCVIDEETGLYSGNDIKKVVEDLLIQYGIKEFRIDTIGQVSCTQGYATNWKQNRIDTGTLVEEVNRDEDNGYDDLENDHGTWHMIPYDLEFSEGTTLWDVFTKIRDLYSGYEMFFDKDGMFIFQLIPICQHDEDILDYTQFDGLVISETPNYDFTSVRNATRVYGQSIETDRYADTSSFIDDVYNEVNIRSIKPVWEIDEFAYSNNITIGVMISEVASNDMNKEAYFTIGNETYPVTQRKAVITEENNTALNTVIYEPMTYASFSTQDSYCFKWSSTQKLWVYAGMYQVIGYCENNNPNSPFAIDKIGYRLQVKTGGDYDNIPTTTLAQERAEYENWLVSRLTDSISLELVIIPFLEVNQKIQYKKLSDGSVDSYIIKSLSYSYTDGTMNMTMNKFYELDPFIVCL